MTRQPGQIRNDAVEVLRDVLRWCLTPAGWAEISAILDTLGTNLDLADPHGLAALARATVALELAGPELLTEVDGAAIPASDSIRERVDSLVDKLTQPTWHAIDADSRGTE